MATTLIFITTITLFLLIVAFLGVVYTFSKKKRELQLKNIIEKQQFEQEISTAQIEMQEQTLKHISQELHDNVGQLLSITSMQLSLLEEELEAPASEKIEATNDLVNKSLEEIRLISKISNTDYIKYSSLIELIRLEGQRLNKLKLINFKVTTSGEAIEVNENDRIIIFRIIQEFTNNTLKHAQASALDVNLIYEENILSLIIKDNGIGFDTIHQEKNSGLLNMKSRAALIKTEYDFYSEKNKGTKLTLKYYLNAS